METNINNKLQLTKLKQDVSAGAFDEQKKKAQRERLEKMIKGALFLEGDEARKDMWIHALPTLSYEEMDALSKSIMRENMACKRGCKIKFEKIEPKKAKKEDEILTEVEKENILEQATGEPQMLDLDFSKTPEDKENLDKLDGLALVLIQGLAEIFDQQGHENFAQTKEKLKTNPATFKVAKQGTQKALLQIEIAMKNWKNKFVNQWNNFVEAAATNFLIAKETQCEIQGTKNNFPQISS